MKAKAGKDNMRKTIKGRKFPFQNALHRVRKYFPQVEEVKDSNESIQIRVIPKDARLGNKKDPAGCALARACVREGLADGAIIGIGMSWLVNGQMATRYSTATTTAREIVSYDRSKQFVKANDYLLSKIAPSNKMGVHYSKPHHSGPTGARPGEPGRDPRPKFRHTTANIRIMK